MEIHGGASVDGLAREAAMSDNLVVSDAVLLL